MDFDHLTEHLPGALRRAFPDLNPVEPLKVLGYGFGSIAVETAGGVVFRVARTAEAGRTYAREMQVLPIFKRHMPVAVPEPAWHIDRSPDFPYGVIGYHKLPGEPLDPDCAKSAGKMPAFAAQIAGILLALQRAPLAEFPLSDNFDGRLAAWRVRRRRVMPLLREALTAAEYRKVDDWWDAFLNDENMRVYQPTLLHGDLWFGNMLVEDGRITGLIDFQYAAVGDLAHDVVPQLYLGEAFMRRVLAEFQAAGGVLDAGFEARLRQWWGVREFGGLLYAVDQNDPEEFADSIEKIRRGPILSPAGLDGWG